MYAHEVAISIEVVRRPDRKQTPLQAVLECSGDWSVLVQSS
jgi:hypothetical protein